MNITDLNPKMKISRNSKLNWAVRPAIQAYTCEEVSGNLAEEISAAETGSKIAADPAPSIEPEDFEAAYRWFYS